jgi:hypothetical protein
VVAKLRTYWWPPILVVLLLCTVTGVSKRAAAMAWHVCERTWGRPSPTVHRDPGAIRQVLAPLGKPVELHWAVVYASDPCIPLPVPGGDFGRWSAVVRLDRPAVDSLMARSTPPPPDTVRDSAGPVTRWVPTAASWSESSTLNTTFTPAGPIEWVEYHVDVADAIVVVTIATDGREP